MVSSIVLGKKNRHVTSSPRPPSPPQRPRIPLAALLRMFLVGSIAVVACAWAIWRYYDAPRAPMLVPAPPDSAGQIEIEVTP